VKKKIDKFPLKKKSLLHIDFFGFYNLIGIKDNTKSLEKFFFNYIEKEYCKKFITPTFNYQFCKKLKTSNDSISELSSISDFFRKKIAKWRSHDPIFSFCGNYKKKLKFNSKLRSFDKNSAIEDIIKDDGYYFFCGTPISFITPGIHYLENLIETKYRYDKIYNGTYKIKNKINKIKYTYKVWPMKNKTTNNEYLVDSRYDAKKINTDLIKAGVMKVIRNKHNNYIMYCKAREFNKFLKNKINNDKLYPLDKKTKSWMKPLLKKLGRSFKLNDFE
jgi:aminoglycoside N3'-acetyltransferase